MRPRTSKHVAKRPMRQRTLPFAEDSSRNSRRGGSAEGGLSLTSFLAMIANAAVSVDGLKRVIFFPLFSPALAPSSPALPPIVRKSKNLDVTDNLGQQFDHTRGEGA